MPTPYVIVPDYNKDLSVLQAFTTKLKTETDTDTLWFIDATDYVYVWVQFLNETQLAEFKLDPAVSIHFRDLSTVII